MSGRRDIFATRLLATAAAALLCLLADGLDPARAPALAAGTAAAAAEEPTREYRLKAAFVYHFLQFTDWPPGAFADGEAPIVVAVVGDDPFHGALEQALGDKTVGGRPVRFEHVPVVPDANAAGMGGGAGGGGGGGFDCHLLFVSPSLARRDVAEVLRRVRGTPVLTVSDGGDDFIEGGGVLRLVVEDNRVRFQVNLGAMRRQQLKLSAKLLKLARVYDEEPRR